MTKEDTRPLTRSAARRGEEGYSQRRNSVRKGQSPLPSALIWKPTKQDTTPVSSTLYTTAAILLSLSSHLDGPADLLDLLLGQLGHELGLDHHRDLGEGTLAQQLRGEGGGRGRGGKDVRLTKQREGV